MTCSFLFSHAIDEQGLCRYAPGRIEPLHVNDIRGRLVDHANRRKDVRREQRRNVPYR